MLQVIGFISPIILKKRKIRYEKPLKVSVGEAMNKAYAKKKSKC